MDLSSKKCVPCEGGVPPLNVEEIEKKLTELSKWNFIHGQIQKEYTFSSYLDGLEFTYKLGKIAEEEGHHPDILTLWSKVRISLVTHSINGLSDNDFIIAAKADKLFEELRQ